MSIHREGQVDFNETGMFHTFQSWEGPVGRHVAGKSEQLASLARVSAGFDTGELVGSIGVNYGRHETSSDLESKVGANPHSPSPKTGYAFWHHEGTWPHWIRPKNPSGVLKFVSRGMVVYARRVWHPGTTPNRFLTRWLRTLF